MQPQNTVAAYNWTTGTRTTYTATAGETAALTEGTYQITTSSDVYMRLGTGSAGSQSAAAAANNMYLSGGLPFTFDVTAAQVAAGANILSVVRVSADGAAYVLKLL